MKKNIIVATFAISAVLAADLSHARFAGSRSSSVGISRSMSSSRPSSTISKPSTSSKPQSYTNPSYSNSNGSNYRPNSYNGSSYNNNGYNNHNYPQTYHAPQNSALRDIGVTAAGVAGGVLAAEAIKGLIAGPHGTYTHPSYPGQYFNQQGAIVAPPVQEQIGSNAVPGGVQQIPQTIVVAPQQHSDFSLWSVMGWIIQILMFAAFLLAIGYGLFKFWRYAKKKVKEEKENMQVDTEAEFNDLDSKAQEIFYDFQKNADNKDWISKHTKYMNADSCVDVACSVEQYEHKTMDVAVEQGKLRASVEYKATLLPTGGELEPIHEIWNFEKQNGVWYVIGVEEA